MSLLPWQRHERDFAASVPGGQTILASGSRVERMDVQTERDGSSWRFLYSLKSTERESIGLKYAWWDEVVKAVGERSVEMRPALGLRFYATGGVRVRADLVVCSLEDWAELLSEIRRTGGDDTNRER